MLVAAWPSRRPAAVTITFYSKELGTTFPHAFVTLNGTLDRSGERIEVDYGFTAKSVTPGHPVRSGRRARSSPITAPPTSGPATSISRLTLSDAEYDRVMASVARWRALPQPSYDLDKRNCVHFVADIAAGLGMRADIPKKLMKKPRSYPRPG